MARTLLVVSVVSAIGLYFMLQWEDTTVELSITINSDLDTVWMHWRNISHFGNFHPFVSVADTIKESHLDDEYGTILADIQIVEQPDYMPVNLSFITKRKTWTKEEKCFTEQISEPWGMLHLNITAILSQEKPGVMRIKEVAYVKYMKLFGQYIVSQLISSHQELLESTKLFIETLK